MLWCFGFDYRVLCCSTTAIGLLRSIGLVVSSLLPQLPRSLGAPPQRFPLLAYLPPLPSHSSPSCHAATLLLLVPCTQCANSCPSHLSSRRRRLVFRVFSTCPKIHLHTFTLPICASQTSHIQIINSYLYTSKNQLTILSTFKQVRKCTFIRK